MNAGDFSWISIQSPCSPIWLSTCIQSLQRKQKENFPFSDGWWQAGYSWEEKGNSAVNFSWKLCNLHRSQQTCQNNSEQHCTTISSISARERRIWGRDSGEEAVSVDAREERLGETVFKFLCFEPLWILAPFLEVNLNQHKLNASGRWQLNCLN